MATGAAKCCDRGPRGAEIEWGDTVPAPHRRVRHERGLGSRFIKPRLAGGAHDLGLIPLCRSARSPCTAMPLGRSPDNVEGPRHWRYSAVGPRTPIIHGRVAVGPHWSPPRVYWFV